MREKSLRRMAEKECLSHNSIQCFAVNSIVLLRYSLNDAIFFSYRFTGHRCLFWHCSRCRFLDLVGIRLVFFHFFCVFLIFLCFFSRFLFFNLFFGFCLFFLLLNFCFSFSDGEWTFDFVFGLEEPTKPSNGEFISKRSVTHPIVLVHSQLSFRDEDAIV